MLFHKMFASIITDVLGLIILVNTVRTQNYQNKSILTTVPARKGQLLANSPMYYDHDMPRKKIYDVDKIDSLYQTHSSYTGLKNLDKFKEEDYYTVFSENIHLINRLHNLYDTSTFSINAYTHLKFDEFTNGYTGFNSTGLTDDDVICFNRNIVQDLPPVIDWSDNMLQNHIQDTKCKNSYVLSALSKLIF